MIFDTNNTSNDNRELRLQPADTIVDCTDNHKCSRCGGCCGLFIPFTNKELATIKNYVAKNNIKPVARKAIKNNISDIHCCFYDIESKKCNIYEVRPYACRGFKCDRKDWKQKRNEFMVRADYNGKLTGKHKVATFDDLIFDDYSFLVSYAFGLLNYIEKAGHGNMSIKDDGIYTNSLVNCLVAIGRLDVLEQFDSITMNDGTEYTGKELIELVRASDEFSDFRAQFDMKRWAKEHKKQKSIKIKLQKLSDTLDAMAKEEGIDLSDLGDLSDLNDLSNLDDLLDLDV